MSLSARDPTPSTLPEDSNWYIEVVAQARAGDKPAFDTLFEYYNARICTYLAHIVGDNEAAPESRISLSGPITLLLSAFSSLFIMISWSSYFQIVHTWVLTALAHFPQNVAYVCSNRHYTYAIRSGSGFILWQQKRYQRHNLLPAATIRWSGVGYIGAGIFYVSALDFCRFTASA